MFNRKSMLVKIWSNAVLKGDKTLDEVPNLSNLIDIVTIIVEEGEIIV